MINETQFSEIVLSNKTKIKYNKGFFGSPMKKFINNIYNTLDIPKETLTISMFYLYKFYKLNKQNFKIMDNFFSKINLFIFSSIIIAIKQLYDENINVKDVSSLFNLNYKDVLTIELIILEGLNWKTHVDCQEYLEFKNLRDNYSCLM